MTKHRSQTIHHGWLLARSAADDSVELDAVDGDRASEALAPELLPVVDEHPFESPAGGA